MKDGTIFLNILKWLTSKKQIKDCLLYPDTITTIDYDDMFGFTISTTKTEKNIFSFPLSI